MRARPSGAAHRRPRQPRPRLRRRRARARGWRRTTSCRCCNAAADVDLEADTVTLLASGLTSCSSSSSPDFARPEPDADPHANLREGWEAVDSGDGRGFYWWNTATNETTWVKPVARDLRNVLPTKPAAPKRRKSFRKLHSCGCGPLQFSRAGCRFYVRYDGQDVTCAAIAAALGALVLVAGGAYLAMGGDVPFGAPSCTAPFDGEGPAPQPCAPPHPPPPRPPPSPPPSPAAASPPPPSPSPSPPPSPDPPPPPRRRRRRRRRRGRRTWRRRRRRLVAGPGFLYLALLASLSCARASSANGSPPASAAPFGDAPPLRRGVRRVRGGVRCVPRQIRPLRPPPLVAAPVASQAAAARRCRQEEWSRWAPRDAQRRRRSGAAQGVVGGTLVHRRPRRRRKPEGGASARLAHRQASGAPAAVNAGVADGARDGGVGRTALRPGARARRRPRQRRARGRAAAPPKTAAVARRRRPRPRRRRRCRRRWAAAARACRVR